MKQFLFHFALLIAAGFVAASVVPAVQAQGTIGLKTSVPFDFQVAGKTVPAGDCTIDMNTAGRVDVHTPDRRLLFVITNPGTTAGSRSKLVFHRYGKTYFLRSVVSRYQPYSLDLPQSKEEKNFANVAGAAPVVETVYVGGTR